MSFFLHCIVLSDSARYFYHFFPVQSFHYDHLTRQLTERGYEQKKKFKYSLAKMAILKISNQEQKKLFLSLSLETHHKTEKLHRRGSIKYRVGEHFKEFHIEVSHKTLSTTVLLIIFYNQEQTKLLLQIFISRIPASRALVVTVYIFYFFLLRITK